jgi:hypothetical protein
VPVATIEHVFDRVERLLEPIHALLMLRRDKPRHDILATSGNLS